ncbi:hypothetical protein [Cytobacillus gottheilii]|uniref:hypothetical protein n=1 Tax=Cytobacillus gottheilii TaxID=859144 RepID=UPI002147A34E|nr:hypothetical protein [Cytobacillus gottheilii]
MLSRKIISASISGSVFAILLAFVSPGITGAGERITSLADYLLQAILVTPAILMYSFPVILLYGVLTSFISDSISEFIAAKIQHDKSEIMFSAVLHIAFGLILLFHSLLASIIFFMTDRILQKRNKEYKPIQSIKSLAIPIAVWLVFMGVVYLETILNPV